VSVFFSVLVGNEVVALREMQRDSHKTIKPTLSTWSRQVDVILCERIVPAFGPRSRTYPASVLGSSLALLTSQHTAGVSTPTAATMHLGALRVVLPLFYALQRNNTRVQLFLQLFSIKSRLSHSFITPCDNYPLHFYCPV